MTKTIILNWFPPGMIYMPSPAMSVLKKYLTSRGFNVSIIYWNIKLLKLQNEFLWNAEQIEYNNEIRSLLIFYNYLAVKTKDHNSYSKIKSILISIKPNYLGVDTYVFDRHMQRYANELEQFINEELDKIETDKILYWGMSVNIFQWVVASIFAKKIKSKFPHVPIVIGGIGTKESAISFLNNFPQFDIAIWGEGEKTLFELTKLLSNDLYLNINNIPNIAYRYNNTVKSSNHSNHDFIDLNDCSIYPNFDDFLQQIKEINIKKQFICLFLEGSRSCHWRKCHFCYLNTGYKHRLKSAQTIADQIRDMIEKYHIYNFYFLDNDVISNDWNRFSSLLDLLISIKNDYPEFSIVLAEIITKNITSDYIRKMSIAGFKHVQIGYESPSNNLLKKIDKKNTLASNLLFIKFAIKYSIYVGGANVIRGLLEETSEDVLEAIENLRYMRFYFQDGIFMHNLSNLGIMSSSRYFKHLDKIKNKCKYNQLVEFLPSNYIKNLEDCNIVEIMVTDVDSGWQNFSAVENYYKLSRYKYNIYDVGNSLIYKEYLNGEIINELEIEKNSIDFFILKNSNDKVLPFESLKEFIYNNDNFKYITDCELFNILDELKNEGIIYAPSDFSEILTIIDLNDII